MPIYNKPYLLHNCFCIIVIEQSKYIKTVFWNVGNLFDIKANEIATDFEFTEERGYDKNAKDEKIRYLAKGIKSLKFDLKNSDNDPDLIGLCEVENEAVLLELVTAINPDKYNIAKYSISPDLRGIDTCLIYSKEMFDCLETKAFDIDFRYPTRDIFFAHLKVKSNDSHLYVLVNHWPSRMGKYQTCQPNDTAQARNTVGERCGKIVDGILKFDRTIVDKFPNLKKTSEEQQYLKELSDLAPDPNLITFLQNNKSIMDQLDEKWNSNVLVMGDFNDEPYDESVSRYLGAVSDIRLCRELIEIFELREREEKNFQDTSYKKYYLEEKPNLFNCMWKFLSNIQTMKYGEEPKNDESSLQCPTAPDYDTPGGSLHYWKTNSWSIFDQFIISRGLYYGKQKLCIDIDSIRIAYKGLRLMDEGNLPHDRFDETPFHTDKQKIHPVLRGTPFSFAFTKNRFDKGSNRWVPNPGSLYPDEVSNQGYSDHFPIQCLIKIL